MAKLWAGSSSAFEVLSAPLEETMKILRRQFAGVILGAIALAAVPVAGGTDDRANRGHVETGSGQFTYKPGPAPKSTTVVVEAAGKGIKVAVDAVNADGSPLKWGFTTLRDGKEEAPVTGNPLFDTVTGTRESANAGTNSTKRAASWSHDQGRHRGRWQVDDADKHWHGREGSGREQRGSVHQAAIEPDRDAGLRPARLAPYGRTRSSAAVIRIPGPAAPYSCSTSSARLASTCF